MEIIVSLTREEIVFDGAQISVSGLCRCVVKLSLITTVHWTMVLY